MPSRLPDDYKSLAIQGWLNEGQRDKIAVDNGLSAAFKDTRLWRGEDG